jgi:group I intron endonuclease
MKKAGVYMIRCSDSEKIYVGSSSNIVKRWSHHRGLLRKGINNSYMQEDYEKYGIESFNMSILELCSPDVFPERETHWINLLSTTDPIKGYNIRTPMGKPLSKNRNTIRYKNKKSSESHYRICLATGSVSLHANNDDDTPKKIQTYLSYWRLDVKHGKRSCQGFLYVREKEYNPDFDYLTFFRPRKTRIKKERVKLNRFEKKAPRKEVQIEHIETGVIQTFSSIIYCCEVMGMLPNKIVKVAKHDYKKYTHKNHWIKFTS